MDEFIFDRADDGDLQAVVKGCNTGDMISEPPSYAWARAFGHEDGYKLVEGEAFKPLKILNSAISVHDYARSPTRKQKQKAAGVSCGDSQEVSKGRRRKSKHKITFVQQVAGDGDHVLSDKWNWRKYGQKTIKGSRYPRNYYKCSSSRECSARKQVEHSSTDPNRFLITYLGEHNHPHPTRRHSQAGRSKERFDALGKVPVTSEPPPNTLTKTENSAIESPFGDDRVLALQRDQDEGCLEDIGGRRAGDFDVANMVWGDDDFFAGLEYLEGLELDLLSDGSTFNPFPSNVP